MRTQRPQPDCPLGPPAAPPSTYPPTPFDTATRQNTLRRNSASGICPIWLRLAKKRRLGARPSRPAYPAVHIPPTRQNPVPRPSRASPPAQLAYPANGSSGRLHPAPAHLTYPSERPTEPAARGPLGSLHGRPAQLTYPAGPQQSPPRPAGLCLPAAPSAPIRRSPHGPPRGTGSASPMSSRHILTTRQTRRRDDLAPPSTPGN